MSDLMREEFEQRFPVPRGVLWRDGAYHREKEKQCTLMAHLFYLGRWEAWRASRECLVIELPDTKEIMPLSPGMYVHEMRKIVDENKYTRAIDLARCAIHAAGVKTK